MIRRNRFHRGLCFLSLAAALVVGSATSAQAQFPAYSNSYYQTPHVSPVISGPSMLHYSPSTSSYYSAPMVQTPYPTAGVSQNYSFYTYPHVTYFPPVAPNYTSSFNSSSVYYPANPMAPYVSNLGQPNMLTPYVLRNPNLYSTPPYNTPTFFRY